MTTVLEEPADLLKLVGQRLGTTDWMKVTQQQVDQFAEATGDHQWIHTDPKRAAKGPFKGTIAHGYLTLSLAPVVISQVLEIRELTAALNYGLNKVRFPSPVQGRRPDPRCCHRDECPAEDLRGRVGVHPDVRDRRRRPPRVRRRCHRVVPMTAAGSREVERGKPYPGARPADPGEGPRGNRRAAGVVQRHRSQPGSARSARGASGSRYDGGAVRRAGQWRLTEFAAAVWVSVFGGRAWAGCSRSLGSTARWMFSVCRGAARWPSSSRFRTRVAAGG